MSPLDDELALELAELERAGLRRVLRRWTGPHGPWITLDGVRLASFSSNNYLGLADHEEIAKAAIDALRESGIGAAASRLIAGNHSEHEALEHDLAQFHGCPAVLLFNSGYQANLGTIPALIGRGDLVVSDELNHASLIDGCRLSRATVEVVRHRDVAAVEEALTRRRNQFRRALIVTESVFSMDGDVAPLRELSDLARVHGSALMVDEAHAVAALGPNGQGICHAAGVVPDVLVGTLGKGFGCAGAYVAGSQLLRTHLVQRARPFVFSTALPPSLAAAARTSLRLVSGSTGNTRRGGLKNLVDAAAARLEELGLLGAGEGNTPIFSIWLGDPDAAVDIADSLLKSGFHVQAIRPPTVPRGTSRLRLSVIATHDLQVLHRLMDELYRFRLEGLLPSRSDLAERRPAP